MRVVIVGGGLGGFSAALVAKRVGADVVLVERSDMLGFGRIL
jgi:flavin-dependent dehydrogenase